jgi:hypothetical protein
MEDAGMSDMMERVARALRDAEFPPNLVNYRPAAKWYRSMAIAAIEAMREPTQAMEEAADAVCNQRDPVDGSHIVLTGYRAMIDAASKEGKGNG